MFISFLLSIIMRFSSCYTFILSSLLLGLTEVVTGEAIAAFYSDLGPGVVLLDSVSREFVYNFYSDTGFHQMQRISPIVTPKANTDIAVTGYKSSGGIYVSIPTEDPVFIRLPSSFSLYLADSCRLLCIIRPPITALFSLISNAPV